MKRFPVLLVFVAGVACMTVALLLQTVTLASGRYGTTLLTALGLMIVDDVCLGAVAWRGGTGWRIAAVLTASPTLFVLSDFLRRAPYVFG